jgi:hypothetical protein
MEFDLFIYVLFTFTSMNVKIVLLPNKFTIIN